MLTTAPTSQGLVEVDHPRHAYFVAQHVDANPLLNYLEAMEESMAQKEEPLADTSGGQSVGWRNAIVTAYQWLTVLRGEKENLLTVTVDTSFSEVHAAGREERGEERGEEESARSDVCSAVYDCVLVLLRTTTCTV